MTEIHTRQIDLNLLIIFDAVMTELNVTRAAERLEMTQPAVSKAIQRLRRILKDELFTRESVGVSPTPKATEIWRPIREALVQIQQTIQPVDFNPATSSATFTLAMVDYAASLILPPLIRQLEQTAPNINLRTVPSQHINAPALLEQGEADLAIGLFPNAGSRFRTHTLLTETHVCAMRRKHPLSRGKLTLKNFAQAKHLLISHTGEAAGFVDEILAEQGLQRRIVLTVNQFAVAPMIIANSDLICTLAARTANSSGVAEHLCLLPLPFELQPSVVKMMWHERNHHHSAHAWLRSLLLRICESIAAMPI